MVLFEAGPSSGKIGDRTSLKSSVGMAQATLALDDLRSRTVQAILEKLVAGSLSRGPALLPVHYASICFEGCFPTVDVLSSFPA